MLYTDIKYINNISPALQQFKRTSPNVYTFRCPFCGDSKKSKTKTRGYLYERQGKFFFKCHNGCPGKSLQNFFREIDPTLYQDYIAECFKGTSVDKQPEPKLPTRNLKKGEWKEAFKTITKVSSLPPTHIAKRYTDSRKIPPTYQRKLFYTKNFYQFCNLMVPDKFPKKMETFIEERIIIPIVNKQNKLVGFQGRALRKSDSKYITIMLDEESLRVYGLDEVDLSKQCFILEGPINSMFIDNSIAMCGADCLTIFELYPDVDFVVVYDNEPRNPEIVAKIELLIEQGKKVVIFPDTYATGLDINDLIKRGHDSVEINYMLNANIYQGLNAKLRLASWRKC